MRPLRIIEYWKRDFGTMHPRIEELRNYPMLKRTRLNFYNDERRNPESEDEILATEKKVF